MLKIAEPLNLLHFSCLNDGLNSVTLEDNDSGSLKCWFSSVPQCDEHINSLYSWSTIVRLSTKNIIFTIYWASHLPEALSINTEQTSWSLELNKNFDLAGVNSVFYICASFTYFKIKPSGTESLASEFLKSRLQFSLWCEWN